MHPDGDVLVFHENTYDAEVRVGGGRGSAAAAPAQVELAFAGGALRHYVAIGGLPMLLDQYTVLTGRPAMPPRWALGYHQCKWGYRSESDIREIAEGFADESVPLSAVHLDIDYMDGYRVFSIDRERFPDMPSLAGSLRERGTRLVAIVDPAVKADPSYDVYRDGVEGGHFVVGEDGHPFLGVVWPGRSAFPDFTDQATRDWWASWYRRLLDQGISGIWHDMNEPTSITLWGDRTLPSGIRHSVEGRGGDHRECHNAYGLLMDRAGWEAMKDFDGERRPFLLSRSGWAGMQRWAWNWTGDIESSWDGLHQQIATAIGLGLSGVPFTGSDIGGFSGIPDSELYLRWLELSVFMPFCRTHSVMGSPNREPWRFQEPYRSAIDRLIRFRYRLLPYLYTLARAANLHGHPFVRPLCWPDENGGSSLARPVDDAFFLGNALLVAPVTSPGASSRSVEVPTGRWYSWRALPAIINGEATDQECDVVSTVEGGRVTTIAVPPGQPGVLVREGTVLGLDDGWGSAVPEPASGSLALSHEPRLLSWHCFPKSDGSAVGVGFDDPGDGTEASRTDRMTLSGAPPVLEWEHDGGYRLPDRVRVVFHGVRASRALVDGKEVETTIRDVGELPSTVVDTVPFGRLQLASVR
ncbi:MAG: glycosyl hydrolase [Actinomycetota bacterium]|jgi:alpha-glucosidase|nr:glycosyl hydrolase [Actinomycetota bacterium]